MKKKLFLIIIISLLFSFGNLTATEAKTIPMDSLIKSSHSAVYYYAADGFRYVFPNAKTYKSWFIDFSEVITVSDQDLAKIPLRDNITYRPGVRMVKIQSNPKVYAVGKGGKLKWVKTEALAEKLYGADWNKKIDDIPVTFFVNYEEDEPIEDETEYDAETEMSETLTINGNIGIEESEKALRANTGVGGGRGEVAIPAIPATSADIENEEPATPIEIEKEKESPIFLYLAEKIGQDDAEFLVEWVRDFDSVMTEEFIDEFIIEYLPGYDVDNDLTIIGDVEAPLFLEIAKDSLDRLYGYSPGLYQYAIGAFRYIRGINFGTRCGSARTGGPWMERNTYNYIYDYKDAPFEKQPPISGFLFIHEATHVKNHALEESGEIRKLTGYENETIAYLAHGYYAKEYIAEDQGILESKFGLTLKEFAMRWTFRCQEEPEDYVWDWDFYVTVLEKAGFPPKELEKLRAYLEITSTAPIISNFQTSKITHSSVRLTWDTDKLAKTTKFEYSLSSDLSSAETLTNGYFGGYGSNHIYELVDLIQGKTYYYRITAIDNSNNVSVSSIHQVTTIYPDTTPPAVPDDQSQFLSQWIYYGSDDKRLKSPRGIAVDTSNNIYVVDSANFRIQKLTKDSIFITQWGSEGTGDGQFKLPSGIAVDVSGNVYVMDNANYNIQKFTSDGTFITKWGSQGKDDGQFYHLFGMAVDANGNVYTADQSNDRIQKFTSDGVFITKWGSDGYSSGQFRNPQGIAIDTSNNVYVIDQNNHRIQKFTSNGVFITEFGSQGRGDGQLYYARGIAIDASDNIYVVDSANFRIQKLTSDGTFITKLGSKGYNSGQFDRPYDIAVDTNGNIYVVEVSPNNRIQKFSPK